MTKLGIPIEDIFRERAQCDPEFRRTMLPDAIDFLLGSEVRVGKIALYHSIYSTIGFERLGELTGKSPKSLKDMLHPDYDTGADDLFEIIGHIRKHEGIRLEVEVHSEETAVTQSA